MWGWLQVVAQVFPTYWVGPLEIAVVHVLVSLPWLRWSLFAVGVYGLVAFIAFDARCDSTRTCSVTER